ncbi:MAG: hypothetical protein KDA41_08970 [Planctomycetales bacterium]|nr:hypothetical protein [Planctomycetales bacterium]
MQIPLWKKLWAICIAAALGVLAGAAPAFAQPGDLARSLAAELGVSGDLGEPTHGAGFAECCRCRVRPQDEVWVISSRHLGWPSCDCETPALKYWRWDCGANKWKKLSADAFFETDSAPVVTFVYVHGNRVNSWLAVDLGWYTYNAVVRQGDEDRPVRYVMYSWPSTEVQGQLKDLRYKAARTDAEAFYLGWVVSHIREDVPVSLMGFSFGSRVITGAMHCAAGGRICGPQLAEGKPHRRNVRTVLMAPALHNYWLSPGCYHGKAMDICEKNVILANSCDPILRHYHWLVRGERPTALGSFGVAWRHPSGRIAEYDCAPCVGKTHDSLMYLNAASTLHKARQCVLWSDAPPSSAGANPNRQTRSS